MQYTIQEVLPGQIRVEYEDGSWAMVPIFANATAEEIDNAVSKYDPDFLPDPETLKNKNIEVGETRSSAQLESSNAYEEAQVAPNNAETVSTDGSSETRIVTREPTDLERSGNDTFTPTIVPNKLDFGLAHPVDVLAIVDYYASKGDTRLKDALTTKIEKFIADPRFSFEEFLDKLSFDADYIFDAAQQELEGN